MRSNSARALAFALIAALATPAMPARATEEDSKTFFAQGRKLRLSGDCAAAIVAFRRALELFPQGLGALRNIAECEEQLGQYASARNDWWSLRRAVLQSGEPKYDGWEKDAEVAYDRLASKVAKMTVRLTGRDLERARVAIDGKPLDPRLLGVQLERDLGQHTVEVFYGGAAPIVERRTLAVGSDEVITIAVPDHAPGTAHASTKAAPVTPIAPAATSSGRGLRTAGVAAITVGGLGAVGIAIAAGVRASALGTIETSCPSLELCSPALRGDYDRGRTASTLVNVFSVVTGVGVAVGVPLLIVGLKRGEAAEASHSASFVVAPVAGGAEARFGVRF